MNVAVLPSSWDYYLYRWRPRCHSYQCCALTLRQDVGCRCSESQSVQQPIILINLSETSTVNCTSVLSKSFVLKTPKWIHRQVFNLKLKLPHYHLVS